jgi:hypothetical protein
MMERSLSLDQLFSEALGCFCSLTDLPIDPNNKPLLLIGIDAKLATCMKVDFI